MTPEILGVDIGGVVISRQPDRSDTSFFHGRYLETPAVPGALDALRAITDAQRFAEVWFVSKCGANVQRKTVEWLHAHDAFTRTGIPEARLRFCLHRPEKATIARELGLTHFVDDRVDVLDAMAEVVRHRFLFGDVKAPGDMIVAPTWRDVLDVLRVAVA